MLINTPLCNHGWKAPEFNLPDADGQHYSLSQLMGEKGLVIAFISNHCPYVKAIAERLAQDAKELRAKGVNFAAVMSNDFRLYTEDSPKHMKQFSQHFGFDFPYLVDESQAVAKAYSAVCTPDFFGLNSKGELQYRGRLDSAAMGKADNRVKELVNAMLLVAETGQGPEEQTASMGCSIKWR